MKRLLIVEDQPADLRIAADLAKSLGISEIEARTSASSAKHYLESALEGATSLPDVIVLDLDLGYESGYELLRYWHGNPQLRSVRFIVWTVMGDEQRDICNLFKVDIVVAKPEGIEALKIALLSSGGDSPAKD